MTIKVYTEEAKRIVEENLALKARVAELEARTVASAEIEEGTLYGSEEAIQGLKVIMEAAAQLARQLNRLMTKA